MIHFSNIWDYLQSRQVILTKSERLFKLKNSLHLKKLKRKNVKEFFAANSINKEMTCSNTGRHAVNWLVDKLLIEFYVWFSEQKHRTSVKHSGLPYYQTLARRFGGKKFFEADIDQVSVCVSGSISTNDFWEWFLRIIFERETFLEGWIDDRLLRCTTSWTPRKIYSVHKLRPPRFNDYKAASAAWRSNAALAAERPRSS